MDQAAYESALHQTLLAVQEERPEFEHRYFRWPILNEDTVLTNFDTHYVYHVAWAVRESGRRRAGRSTWILRPASISAPRSRRFCETEFYDFRPAPITMEGLTCPEGRPDGP